MYRVIPRRQVLLILGISHRWGWKTIRLRKRKIWKYNHLFKTSAAEKPSQWTLNDLPWKLNADSSTLDENISRSRFEIEIGRCRRKKKRIYRWSEIFGIIEISFSINKLPEMALLWPRAASKVKTLPMFCMLHVSRSSQLKLSSRAIQWN